jgi:FAD/FMN-containing dehydrogenase
VLRAGRDDTTRYATPARGPAGGEADVVRPASTDEVRHVVRWARDHRIRLLPQGANSGLVGASTPPGASAHDGGLVVLSTERLRDELRIDPADRTAVVPAGLRLSELNLAAAEHGLWFPIDLGADPSVGGMVATDTGGARMLRHGDVRRNTLGVEVVLADEDASVVDTLRTYRKRNEGVDPTGLFVGSSGAFGILTRAALDLSVRPAETAAAWIPLDDPSDAVVLLGHLESRLDPLLSAYEVVSAAALDAAAAAGRPLALRPAPWAVLVEVAGPTGCGEHLVSAASTAPVDTSGALVLPPVRAWAVRHAVTEGLARSGHVIGHDVAVPRAALPDLVTRATAAIGRSWPRATVADFGHWGDGGVHLNVVFPHGDPVDETLVDEIHDLVFALAVDEFGGTFSAEHGVGPANAAWWRRTAPDAVVTLVGAMRAVCDPLDLLGHPGLPYPRADRGLSG